MRRLRIKFLFWLENRINKLKLRIVKKRKFKAEDRVDYDIWEHDQLMDVYLDSVSHDDPELRQLQENSKNQILRESAVSGISPVANLTFPVLEKTWSKFALKEIFKVEVAKTPRFVVAYTEPYMFNVDGAGKTHRKMILDDILDDMMEHNYDEEYGSWSIGFDISRKDICIPTGQHINAPLPIEFISPTNVEDKIQHEEEVSELMSNIMSQKLDMEVLEFFDNDIENNKKEDETEYTFDARPAAGYAGSPKAWREMLKPIIDHAATTIKNNTFLQGGSFRLAGNPIDINLLTNVDWTLRSSMQKVNGCDVNYSIGTYIGAQSYTVISTPNIPQGKLLLVFIPNSNTQMTYKYYPYAFNVEHAYLDPNRVNTPSVMMSKRQQFTSFLPAAKYINILNNEGFSMFDTHTPAIDWTMFDEEDEEIHLEVDLDDLK